MPSFSLRPAIAAVSIAALACSATACGPSSDDAAKTADHVTVALPADWQTLDPHKNNTGFAKQLIMHAYDQLVALDDKGNVVPYLAKSWRATPSKITLTLRTDVTCADGTKVTPDVVYKSFERLFDPDTGSPFLARNLGPGPYRVASDDEANSVTISLETPFADALRGLADPSTSIVCPTGLRDPKSLRAKPAGTGPYELTHSVRGDTYTMKLRSGYEWAPNGLGTTGAPKKIDWKVLADNTTSVNSLVTNRVDATTVSAVDEKRLKGRGMFTTSASGYGVHLFVMNERPGSLGASAAMREAVFTAIDRTAWNQAAFQGLAEPSSSIVAKKTPCFDASTEQLLPKSGAEQARQLLARQGYRPGAGKMLAKNGKPLKLRVLVWDDYKSAADLVLDQLRKAGIDASVRKVDVGTLVSSFTKGDFDLTVLPIDNDSPSPSGVAPFISGKTSQNFAKIENRTFDRAAAAANAAPNEKVRCAEWAKGQRALLERHDVLPTASGQARWYADGWQFDTRGSWIAPLTLRPRS